MTGRRGEMKRFTRFQTELRKLPVVFSAADVSDILMAAPGPELKYRAVRSISYDAGIRSTDVCNFNVGSIECKLMPALPTQLSIPGYGH